MLVLFVLLIASSLTSLDRFRTTSRMVEEDMDQALAKTLEEQQSDVISADTIRVFNSHLQMKELRGKAVLTVGTKRDFRPRPQVSVATILSLSDQRPSMVLWSMVLFWGLYCIFLHRQRMTSGMYGGLALEDGQFIDTKGNVVRLTPMQQQLMEMLWLSPSHHLSKTDICNVLWPKKENANDTLYTLVKRLKPIIEQHSDLKIEADRGKSYGLKIK